MPIESSHVVLNVSDGTTMKAYVSRPSNAGPHPGMLVIQEALGVNSQIRGVADRYARLGFVAIAPEMFHRVKPGYEKHTLVIDEIMPLIRTLTTEGLIADVTAAYEWLTAESDVEIKQIACMGFCMGGRATYLANSALPLAAAISYYGGSIAPTLLDRAASLHAPHLFFWGGQDRSIPIEQRRAVIDAVRTAGKSFVDVEFSDCSHAFFNEQVERYNAPAAKQSWALGVAFLENAMGITLTDHDT